MPDTFKAVVLISSAASLCQYLFQIPDTVWLLPRSYRHKEAAEDIKTTALNVSGIVSIHLYVLAICTTEIELNSLHTNIRGNELQGRRQVFIIPMFLVLIQLILVKHVILQKQLINTICLLLLLL